MSLQSNWSPPSGGWFVYKHPQYIEEVLFGTMPTTPTLNWIGPSESWDPRADIPPIEIRQLGSEDPRFLLKGQENYEFTLEYFMQGATWSKYFINAQGGGAGSIDKSLSICAGIRMGGAAGAVYYYKMLGCRPRTLTLTGRVNEAIRGRAELVCREIPIPGTVDPTGWASDPGTSPYIFSSGGVSPIMVGGTSVPCTEITASIERNPETIFVMGSGLAEYIPPKQRKVSGTMTLVWNSMARYTDMKGYTDRDVVWLINATPSVTLTMSSCKFHRLDSFRVQPTEVQFERWAFTGLSASLV
jgi:hypothetical protein